MSDTYPHTTAAKPTTVDPYLEEFEELHDQAERQPFDETDDRPNVEWPDEPQAGSQTVDEDPGEDSIP